MCIKLFANVSPDLIADWKPNVTWCSFCGCPVSLFELMTVFLVLISFYLPEFRRELVSNITICFSFVHLGGRGTSCFPSLAARVCENLDGDTIMLTPLLIECLWAIHLRYPQIPARRPDAQDLQSNDLANQSKFCTFF